MFLFGKNFNGSGQMGNGPSGVITTCNVSLDNIRVTGHPTR